MKQLLSTALLLCITLGAFAQEYVPYIPEDQLPPMDFKAQREILEKLLGKIGEGSAIYPPFWCDYGYSVRCSPT